MKTLNLVLIATALSFSPAAFAKGKGGTPQTHHCVKDGATVQKTKKECLKDGGTWAKNDDAGTAKPGDKPAPGPTTK